MPNYSVILIISISLLSLFRSFNGFGGDFVRSYGLNGYLTDYFFGVYGY